jgi:purine-nucleoside phosphorylase
LVQLDAGKNRCHPEQSEGSLLACGSLRRARPFARAADDPARRYRRLRANQGTDFMESLQGRIDESVAEIRRHWTVSAKAAVVLGTGMAPIADRFDRQSVLPYEAVPHFPRLTALGHQGRLLCGTLSGIPVVMMDGRPHVYEGHAPAAIALPVRVMRALGADLLVLSNASGGINPNYQSGDIVVIEGHINLTGVPVVGGGDDRVLRRFDPGRLYDRALIDRALSIARREGFVAHRGVYVGVTGPNYETRAEYRFFRRIGGDVVGMSTVPEALVAAECGLRVLALSAVTNVARPDAPQRVDAHEVLDRSAAAAPNVAKIVMAVLSGVEAATRS